MFARSAVDGAGARGDPMGAEVPGPRPVAAQSPPAVVITTATPITNLPPRVTPIPAVVAAAPTPADTPAAPGAWETAAAEATPAVELTAPAAIAARAQLAGDGELSYFVGVAVSEQLHGIQRLVRQSALYRVHDELAVVARNIMSSTSCNRRHARGHRALKEGDGGRKEK